MNFTINAKISAIGMYVPEKKMTNDDFSKIVETSDEWIFSRTGIKERRISQDNEYSSSLAIKAVQDLIDSNNINIDNVDFIIVSSISCDYQTPSISALIQSHFGIKNAGSFDINAACSGYVYGLQTAFSFIASGQYRNILLVTADTLSKLVDYTDRTTCVLFGDAATATLIQKDETNQTVYSFSGTDGTLGKMLYCSNVSDLIDGESILKQRKIVQNGKALYSYVTRDISNYVQDYLIKNSISLDSIDWFIPHSANERMIIKLNEHIGIPKEKTLLSLSLFGNTSSNTIPLSLCEAIRNNSLRRGDRILLLGFGGGFTYAGLIFNF